MDFSVLTIGCVVTTGEVKILAVVIPDVELRDICVYFCHLALIWLRFFYTIEYCSGTSEK